MLLAFYSDLADSAHGGRDRNSTDNIKKELTNLSEQNVNSTILDARLNGGGFLGLYLK